MERPMLHLTKREALTTVSALKFMLDAFNGIQESDKIYLLHNKVNAWLDTTGGDEWRFELIERAKKKKNLTPSTKKLLKKAEEELKITYNL